MSMYCGFCNVEYIKGNQILLNIATDVKVKKGQTVLLIYEKERKLLIKPETLAKRFHTWYESLASKYGYKTRKKSAVPWSEVPKNNRDLMTAVCRQILDELQQ